MTDDLKERLLSWHPGQDEEALREEAVARITDLEARLAAAEAEVQRIKKINVAHCRTVNTLLVCESRMETRAKAAEAGEDALAKAGSEARIALAGMVRPDNAVNLLDDALAAYEARRKG